MFGKLKTTTMKIEVKKVKFGPDGTHQETLNFGCDVFIDGIYRATASNDGRGGMTRVYPTAISNVAIVKEAQLYCKSLPPTKHVIDGEEWEFDVTLDSLIDDLVHVEYNKKQVAKIYKSLVKKCNNNIVVVNPADLDAPNGFTYSTYKLAAPISELLSTDKGKTYLKTSVQRAKGGLKEGEVIFNENLQEIINLV